MVRELEFMRTREEPGLAQLTGMGWTATHLHVIFVMNSIYQRVLGPSLAAARGGPEGLGTTIPVRHGSLVFDLKSARIVNDAWSSFQRITLKLGVRTRWLQANTCSDLVYAMTGGSKDVEEHDDEDLQE